MSIALPLNSKWARRLLAIVAAAVLVVSAANFYGDWRFRQTAQHTRGTVIRKQVRTTSSHRRRTGAGSRSPHYEVYFRFVVEGKTFEGSDELNEDDWRKLAEGSTVDVLYSPTSPAANRLVH